MVTLDVAGIKEKYPLLDNTSYFPPRRPEDDQFGIANPDPLIGAIYYPEGGFVSDPILCLTHFTICLQRNTIFVPQPAEYCHFSLFEPASFAITIRIYKP